MIRLTLLALDGLVFGVVNYQTRISMKRDQTAVRLSPAYFQKLFYYGATANNSQHFLMPCILGKKN